MASRSSTARSRARRADIHAAIDCLRQLTELFEDRRAQLASDAGVTEHQWRVLEEISTENFMPSMFARRRESSAAAVSKTLRQLLDKGLVSVAVSLEDGRQRDYGLTAKGRRVLEQLAEKREEAIRSVWADVDSRELETFTRFGQDLIVRLNDYTNRLSPGRSTK